MKPEGSGNNEDVDNVNSESKADTPPEINFDDFRAPLKKLILQSNRLKSGSLMRFFSVIKL